MAGRGEARWINADDHLLRRLDQRRPWRSGYLRADYRDAQAARHRAHRAFRQCVADRRRRSDARLRYSRSRSRVAEERRRPRCRGDDAEFGCGLRDRPRRRMGQARRLPLPTVARPQAVRNDRRLRGCSCVRVHRRRAIAGNPQDRDWSVFVIFAFLEGGMIEVHANAADAKIEFKARDIESHAVVFYAEDGTYLKPELATPHKRRLFGLVTVEGEYDLVRCDP